MTRLLTSLLMVVLTVRCACATTYYVALGGSGANSGLTPQAPWDSATMLAACTNGNVFLTAPGVWTSTWTIPAGSGNFTIRAQQKWMTEVAPTTGYGIVTTFTPYVTNGTIDGIQISGASADGIGWAGTGLILTNCWVHDSVWQGLNVSGPADSNNVVKMCLFEGNGATNDNAHGPHYHNMYIAGSGNDVENNVLRNPHNGGNCQFFTSYANTVDQNIFRNNLSYGTTNFYGVICWSTNGAGTGALGTNIFENNTILDGMQARFGWIIGTNNIGTPSPIDPSEFMSQGGGVTVISDYNCCTNAVSFSGTTQPHDVITTYANLGFVAPSRGLYWIKSSSAANGAALTTVHGPQDFYGNSISSATAIGFIPVYPQLSLDPRFMDLSLINGAPGYSPTNGANYWLPPETNWVVFAATNGSQFSDGMTPTTAWPLGFSLINAGTSNNVGTLPGFYSWSSNVTITANYLTVSNVPKWTAVLGNITGNHPWYLASGVSGLTVDGLACLTNQFDVYLSAVDYTSSNCVGRNLWCRQTGTGFAPSSSASGIECAGRNMLLERILSELNGTNNIGQNHGLYVGGFNNTYRNNVLRGNGGNGLYLTSHGNMIETNDFIYQNHLINNLAFFTVGNNNQMGLDQSAFTNVPASWNIYVFNNTIISTGNVPGLVIFGTNNGIYSITNNEFGVGNSPIKLFSGGASIQDGFNRTNTPLSDFENTGNGLYWKTATSGSRGIANPNVFAPFNFLGQSQTSITDVGFFPYSSVYAADNRVLDPSPANGADYWAILTPGQVGQQIAIVQSLKIGQAHVGP